MKSVNDALAATLAAVQRPGDYFVSGTVDAYLPNLEVEAVGRIALPLLPQQAQQLMAVATPAPYGRGTETLIDTKVRKTWQINANQVQLGGRHWPQTLQSILDRVVTGLSVTEPVSAELYKLLVYQSGDFFINHRDTEKVPGMFATLVIVLPSVYTGGELIIRHNNREVELDLCRDDASEVVAFAAFYADCVHEVKPVTSGCRLTLIYNLVRQGTGRPPEAPGYESERDCVAALLQQWVKAQTAAEAAFPEKLIYPLEHAYTAAELAFDRLKGADAAVAPVLLAATEQAECELHLALLTIAESGSAEYAEYQPRRGHYRGSYGEESFEVGEVFERTAHLSEWRTASGQNAGLRELPFKEEEICPLDALGDMEDAELEFHEATGNEGVSFDRTYCRAAFVIWPNGQKLAIINQAGLTRSLPYLSELVTRSNQAEGDATSFKQQALQLAALMLSTWPRRTHYYGSDPDPKTMLGLLQQLADGALIERFLVEVSAQGSYGKADNPALLAACQLLPMARAIELLAQIIIANKDVALAGYCGLLHASVSLAGDAALLTKLLPAATSLCQTLPDGTAKAGAPAQARILDSEMIVDLLRALGRLDAVLGGQLTASTSRRILEMPKIYPMDRLVVPVALQMVGATGADLLHQASLDHLKNRVAQALAAPADWRRDGTIACRCKDCAELSRFLADPTLAKWIFKAAEPARRHVQDSITRSHADVDCTTDTGGRPYRLVCAKNQASYQRRVAQRARDIADLARLEQTPG